VEGDEVMIRIAQVMSAPTLSVTPETRVSDAARYLLQRDVVVLPVVAAGGELVGMVSVRPAAPTSRPADHRCLVVLTLQECLARLRSTPVGRFAFVVQGAPVVLPVNHGLDGTTVIFRTTWGSKLQIRQATERVAFEADGFDTGTGGAEELVVRSSLRLPGGGARSPRREQPADEAADHPDHEP
jgi:hypothetical protein